MSSLGQVGHGLHVEVALVIMISVRIKVLGLTGIWCRVLEVWGSSSKTRTSNVASVLLAALALVWVAVKELSSSYYNKEALLSSKYCKMVT